MGAGSWPSGSIIAGGNVYVSSPAVPLFSASARFNPATQDCDVLSDGSIAVVHYIDQIVALALGVELGSIPAAPTVGIRLAGIRKSTIATLQRAVEDAVNGSLATLLAAKSIRINSITSTYAPGRRTWATNYTNLVSPSARSPTVNGAV